MPRFPLIALAAVLPALVCLLRAEPAPAQDWEPLLASESQQCAVYLGSASPARDCGSVEAARCRFMEFAGHWLARIGRNLRHTEDDVHVEPAGDGYVARFVRLDRTTARISIKPSPSSASPYVGVLRYEEHHYEARGRSPQAATSASFERVRRMRVTEIFRYVSGRWTN
ncbi:hypothetical protein [Desulfocurvus sp. DL9XJH121]